MPERSGPVVIAYDGSAASEHGLREAAALLAPRPALVVVVWEAGAGFEMMELPRAEVGVSAVPLDVGAAVEADQALYEQAQRVAAHGAELARERGLEAETLVVADEVTVAATLVRLAEERDAQAIVVGTHGHGRLSGMLLGSTSQSLVRHAP
ncbi:MAG: universal stress protein, partial [Nocardioidaceae bacterium]